MSMTFFFFFIDHSEDLSEDSPQDQDYPTRWSEESYCNSALGWFKVQFEKDLTVPFEIDDIEVKLL